MAEFVPYDDLQRQIRDAVQELDAVATADDRSPDATSAADVTSTPVAAALRATLLVAAESMGECREALPYAPMHPVRSPDGRFQWCCTHDPEHCGEHA